MIAAHCAACRFWKPVPDPTVDNPKEGPGWGWCRREAPRVSDHMARMTIQPPGFGRGPSCPEESATVDAVADATIFPATHRSVWCGRFEPAFAPIPSTAAQSADAMLARGREAFHSARADLREETAA